jgi:hypothetical protein
VDEAGQSMAHSLMIFQPCFFVYAIMRICLQGRLGELCF